MVRRVFKVFAQRHDVATKQEFQRLDKSKKRGFPVVARLTYDEDGRHYEGTLETVYDWSETKEITVELKLSTDNLRCRNFIFCFGGLILMGGYGILHHFTP